MTGSEVDLIVQQLFFPFYLSMFVSVPQSICLDAHQLYNSFKLTGIAQSVLYHHLAHFLVLVAVITFSSIGEVDVAIADNPTTVVGKRDNVAL